MAAAVGLREYVIGEDYVPQLPQLDEENLEECFRVCKKAKAVMTDWLILVNIASQKAHVFNGLKLQTSYPVSTSAQGAGQEEGSLQTPLGLHCIKDKIGDGADPLAIFKSRELTGELASPEAGGKAIVGRILRISGLEKSYNQGLNAANKNVDSYNRYIYFHGTNDIGSIGKPASQGCVRMLPQHIIELFDNVPEGSLVYIYQDIKI